VAPRGTIGGMSTSNYSNSLPIPRLLRRNPYDSSDYRKLELAGVAGIDRGRPEIAWYNVLLSFERSKVRYALGHPFPQFSPVFFLPSGGASKWPNCPRPGRRAVASCGARTPWAVTSPRHPLGPLGPSGRDLDSGPFVGCQAFTRDAWYQGCAAAVPRFTRS
jgi:hypothetical protein